jgi:hypothetical protein
MSAAWDAWLAECLGALDIDADVFGPYVTGIMVRLATAWPANCVRCRAPVRVGASGIGFALVCKMLIPLAVPQEDETQQEAERASSVVRRFRIRETLGHMRRVACAHAQALTPPVLLAARFAGGRQSERHRRRWNRGAPDAAVA